MLKRNRLRLSLMMCALLFFAPLAKNQGTAARRDGNWWRAQTEPARIGYVNGFIDGMRLGYNFTTWKLSRNDKECKQQTAESYFDYQAKFLYNVTIGQLSDGLNTFYENDRNRHILINEALWPVMNEIAGTPKDKTEKLIENLRHSPQ